MSTEGREGVAALQGLRQVVEGDSIKAIPEASEVERLTAEVALYRERDALTRKALQTDSDGPLQFAALIVRQQRDKAVAEVSRLREQLATAQDELVAQNRLYRRVGAERDEKQFEVERLRRWVDRFRERLAAAVVLPQNWTQQIGWLFDVDEGERYTNVVRLVQMWQGGRDGTGDTEAEEAAPVSESVPVTPQQELK